jgi:flagellin-like protein
MEQKGVSPVVGTILLIAITVALAAIVAMLVSGLGGRGAPPSARLTVTAANIDPTSVMITISHEGGDDLNISDIEVQASDTSGTMQTATLSPSSGTLSVGGKLTATYSYGGSAGDKVITVYVIHKPSKQKLFSSARIISVYQPGPSLGWWDSSWTKRRPITFDYYGNVPYENTLHENNTDFYVSGFWAGWVQAKKWTATANGSLEITFSIAGSYSEDYDDIIPAHGQIYRNDVAVGIDHSTQWDLEYFYYGEGYQSFTETISGWTARDNVILKICTEDWDVWDSTAYSENFKVENLVDNYGVHIPPENYQYKIVISYDSDMRSDYGDLRFTENVDGPLLNYWVENYTVDNATIWVRRLENADSTIYVYYGNSGATSQSNENTTFIRVIDNVAATWHLNEGSGMTAYDTSGNGYNGTLNNDPTWVYGEFGSALNFDGSDDYVDVGDLGVRPIEGTISYWMKSDAVESYRNTMSTGDGNVGFRFEQDSGGGFYGVIGDDDGNFEGHTYSTSLQAGIWYHVVLTWDSSQNKVWGYLNGEQKFAEGQSLWATNLEQVKLGVGFGSDRVFDGILDEIAIWNRALDENEVLDLYNNYGYTTPNYPGNALVRKYAFPEPTTSVGAEEL